MIGEAVDSFNQRTFRRPDLVRQYAGWDWIETGEDCLLHEVGKEVRNAETLELGVGAGRFVSRLCRLGSRYVGIDYSPEMVAACREKFPAVSFLCCDARDLAPFESNRFTLAVFSFNGLDYVSHEGRLLVLSEIYRVLRKGGQLLFSSHNLESKLYPGHSNSVHQGYSVVSEQTGDFSYQCYFIRRAEMLRQLWTAGFTEVAFCNRDGREPSQDLRSGWLHYLARK